MSAVAAVAPETAGAMAVASDVAVRAEGAIEDIAEAAGQRVPLEIYEHHGSFLFPKWSLASGAAPLILRQERRRASIATGEGGCHDFSPAHRFELQGHPAAQANGGYVVTSVVHHGQSTPREREDHRVYFNTFECAPASMPYPPKRPKRRSIQVALTAVVVGPPGDDIHVDKMGRVKVQFHWDRDGKYDGRSSCWIRTMQAWGGTAWGHQFIPRVGMEVAIAFEGGDPDKPMVLGSFYNATHPPSFPLPMDKTRSGIRTQSSPQGNGYNELSFEDRRGQEEVYLHAQRDLREEILADRTTTVGKTQSTTIKKDLIEQVAGDHHSHVRGIHYDFVKNNRLSSVTGAYSVAVRGEMSIVVGTKDKPKAGELFTHGDTIVGGSKSVVLRSDNRIRLEVGESSIEIGPKEIRLTSDKIVLDGQSSTLLKGKGPAMKLGDEAELVAKSIKIVSEKGSMMLNKEVTIDAPKIFMNCPGVAKLAGAWKVPKTKKLKLRLSDEAFKPLAGKEYILAAAGAKFEGTTGGDGELELDIPDETQTVTLVVFEERPEGRQYKFRIQIADVPPTDDVAGIKARLQNLGYYWGEVDDVFDDWTRAALREFQSDHGIEVTGDIDGPTKQKLQDLARV